MLTNSDHEMKDAGFWFLVQVVGFFGVGVSGVAVVPQVSQGIIRQQKNNFPVMPF